MKCVMNRTNINPIVSNWKDLTDQFDFIPIGNNYKTALEIYDDLKFANTQLDLDDITLEYKTVKNGILIYVPDKNSMNIPTIAIDCEKNNYDSAACIFQYCGMEGKQRVYEFTGTAK